MTVWRRDVLRHAFAKFRHVAFSDKEPGKERGVRKGVVRLQKRVPLAWSVSAPRINLQLIICSCTHLRFIKPDQLTREPVGWDKLAASEVKDGIARYVK